MSSKSGQIGYLILELRLLDCWKSVFDFFISVTQNQFYLELPESCRQGRHGWILSWKPGQIESLSIELQYGSGKKKNSIHRPILQSSIFRRVVWSKPLCVKKFYAKLCAWYSEDIPRTSVYPCYSECLRVAIDYSVQVSFTARIILSFSLSHDGNQTKLVTTANTINNP